MTQRKFFIDCGAHTGESIRLFRTQYPNSADYKIISIEANQDHKHYFETPEFADVDFYNVALSTEDGFADFYHHDWTVGMTLCKENKRVHLEIPPMRVPTIDFSQWMLKNFTADDYIILKLDVEGSEYEILNKMFKDGSFDLIDKLYIEWHYGNRPISKEEHDRVVAEVNRRGIKDWDWCAGPGRTLILGKEEV